MRPSWYTRAAVMATVMTVAIVTWAAATVAAPKDSHTPAARLSHWTLNSSEIFGLSDWTLIGGKRWAVTEDRHRLVEIIGAPGKQLSYGATQPIHGIPAGWDIEALTALSDDMLLAGTERDGARDEDYIFTLVRQAKGFAATGRIAVPYGHWGIRARHNKGIEGLCFADPYIFAASETIIERDGQRLAPFVRMRRDGSEQVPLMIALTSGQGKISALACHRSSTGVRLVAIERHFEVSRVLRFPVDNETASGKMITPRILLDMQPTPDGRLPNYEGILWENDGWWMISDNHYGRITGPTDVLHLGDGPAP